MSRLTDRVPKDEQLLIVCGRVSLRRLHKPRYSSDQGTRRVGIRFRSPAIDVVSADSEFNYRLKCKVESRRIGEQRHRYDTSRRSNDN